MLKYKRKEIKIRNEEEQMQKQEEKQNNVETVKNHENCRGEHCSSAKPTFKEKLQKFLKNKKALAMVIEYILTIECFAMLFLLTSPSSAKAAVSVADENGITWNYTVSNGQATNVYYASGTLGETVTIPSTLSDEEGNEYPVVSLYYSNRNIFKSNRNTTIKNIIIPSSVTSIGNNAFAYCTGLKKITMPGTASIGDGAFYKVTNVEEVTLTGQGAMPNYSSSYSYTPWYQSRNKIQSITIGEGITSVGDYVFYGNSNLEEIELSENITSIGQNAFSSNTDVYIDNLEEDVECSSNTGGILHFINCRHNINIIIDPREKIEIIDEEGDIVEGKIRCRDTYKFKLKNQNGEIVKDKVIKIERGNNVIEELHPNEEGIFSQEEIVVTYVYEKVPSGIITVKYVDKDGKEISDKIEVQGYLGDKYEILRKNIEGYKAYGVTPENAKGTYTSENIEVIFVYEAIEEEKVVKYVDENGNYIARDKTVYDDDEIVAKDIDGYENPKKEENGKEITYTYEEAKTKGNKWTTEKTLLAIAGMIAVLTIIFIIIAKREKNKEEEE